MCNAVYKPHHSWIHKVRRIMQPLIFLNSEGLRSNPGLFIGWAILAGVAIQTGLAVASAVRRFFARSRQLTLEQERLHHLVRAAKAELQQAEAGKATWNGYRKFRVDQKVFECDGVYSLYLKPHDGKPLPGFKPGQYLTLGLDIPGRTKQVVKCYSLSDCDAVKDYYRLTIKWEKSPKDKPGIPPGVGSSFLTQKAQVGDLLNVKAPSGHFYLDLAQTTPVVLMGAGVGITPVLTMANAIAASGSKREAWFFFVCRNGEEHILRADIERLRPLENLHVVVCYSRPGPQEIRGRHYDREGRLTPDLLKELLPSNNYSFLMCGSGPFMKDMYEGLIAWGVPDERIHFEAFGPASVKRVSQAKPATTAAPETARATVTFAKSGKTAVWDGSVSNLYELAAAQQVRIDYGCGAGSCGSCAVAVRVGEVVYKDAPGFSVEAGSCLTCVGCPVGNVTLDA